MEVPLFELGILADVQYADMENGHVESRVQSYREAPAKMRLALADLRQRQVTSILQLGDIINGNSTMQKTMADMDVITNIISEEIGDAVPLVHTLGNHCLAAGRSTLTERLHLPDPGYFTMQLPHAWRLIVLDSTEMSGHSDFPEGSWQWKEARAYEKEHPLSDAEPQMSFWNGGVSQRQLQWLKEELHKAETSGGKVIIAVHHQFGAGAARATHMAWNHKDIMEVCVNSPAFRLVLAGHDHIGGYSSVGAVQHFVTLEAVLEAPTGSNAYGTLAVFPDRLEIRGEGALTSRTLAI